MSINIQKIRTEAEKWLKVKSGEWITHALFRAGLWNGEVLLNTLELQAEFSKISRANRKAIIDLAKEIEQTTKLPVPPEAIIQLKKQTTTKEEVGIPPRVSEQRYPPHIPSLSLENKPHSNTDFNPIEISYVKKLFEVIQHWEWKKDWYIADNRESILIPQKWGESYYLWDKENSGTRNIYYLDKTGIPVWSVLINRKWEIQAKKWNINITWLTFRPTIYT